MRLFVLAACALVGFSCGPTIGDPCTTPNDCGTGTCLNRDWSPGGYCSLACGPTTACPAGTVCVSQVLAQNTAGCMRQCVTDKDCRLGYVCQKQQDSLVTVCVGPRGL